MVMTLPITPHLFPDSSMQAAIALTLGGIGSHLAARQDMTAGCQNAIFSLANAMPAMPLNVILSCPQKLARRLSSRQRRAGSADVKISPILRLALWKPTENRRWLTC